MPPGSTSESPADAELLSGRHPVRELLTAVAADAEITEGDLDFVVSHSRAGQSAEVRQRLVDTVGQIRRLRSQGRNSEARQTAKRASLGLAAMVEPTRPRQGVFDRRDDETPAGLARQVPRR